MSFKPTLSMAQNKPTKVFTESKNRMTATLANRPVKAMGPVALSHDIPAGTQLTFVDIAHSLATIDVNSKLNRFSALVDTANEWLRKNRMLWHLESCETVSLVFKSEHLDTIDYGATQRQLLPHINYDGDECVLLKALRLWISKKDDIFEPEVKNELNVQTIGCQTFLPKSCKYFNQQIGWEQLDDVVTAVNKAITTGAISGQLLNIESVNYDATEDWVVDTETPKQREIGDKQMMCLRVYYATTAGDTAPACRGPPEEVSIFDFVPELVVANTVPPKFEPFTTLLLKVQEFLDDNREYRVLNAQTLDVRYKSVDEIQTHFMVNVNDIGFYLRCLRLVCTRVPAPPLTTNANNSLARDRHSISTNTDTCHPNAVQTLRNDDPIGVTPDLLTPDLTEVEEDRDDNESVHEQPQHLVFNRKQPVLNFESHYIRIMYDHNLHGPLYTCKRHLEFFMERDEWRAPGVEHRWTYLCAETIPVLAKDEDEIADKIDVTLFTTKHTLLVMPRVFYVVRLYFDTRVEFVGPPYGAGSTKRSLLKSFSLRSNSDRQSLKREWFERRTHSEVSAYQANSMDEEAKTAPVAPDVAKDKDKRVSMTCVMI